MDKAVPIRILIQRAIDFAKFDKTTPWCRCLPGGEGVMCDLGLPCGRPDCEWNLMAPQPVKEPAPTPETVERVARAIHDADCYCGDWESDAYQAGYREMARAALAAMREGA